MIPMSYTSRGEKRRRRYAQGQPARKEQDWPGNQGHLSTKGLSRPHLSRGGKAARAGPVRTLWEACKSWLGPAGMGIHMGGGGEWGMGRVDAQ